MCLLHLMLLLLLLLLLHLSKHVVRHLPHVLGHLRHLAHLLRHHLGPSHRVLPRRRAWVGGRLCKVRVEARRHVLDIRIRLWRSVLGWNR